MASSTSPADPLSAVVATLKRDQIIPDVITDPNFQPSILFSVTFPSGSHVEPGGKIPRNDTLEEPSIDIVPMGIPKRASGGLVDEDRGGEVSYTLVMTDPDAPSRSDNKYGQWRHWVITGLQLPAAADTKTSNLVALKTKAPTTPYIAPGPPKGSGFHRYVFLLFQEPEGQFVIPGDAMEHRNKFEERRSWNAIAFAERYKLTLVGATFFLTCSSEDSEV